MSMKNEAAQSPPRFFRDANGIHGFTINAAYASFEEDIKGAIEVGKLADITVLSDNLFEISSDKAKDVEVLLTIVGGKEIFRSDEW